MEKLDEPFMIRSRNYKEIVEYIDQPPCKKMKKCLVQATCYESSIDEDDDISINLNRPCEEAMDWFITAEIIDEELELLRKEDGSILSAEDIIKIISYWNCDSMLLEKLIGLSFSAINKIGTFINELNSDYCSTNKIDCKKVIIIIDPIEEAFENLKRNPASSLSGESTFVDDFEKIGITVTVS